ncbi:cyclic nucleotide-binding domain-containing protein [Candidatus Peregrinibacteria bacterium]|nr:cyclic nucleotide-binding domain-containing protein [Candidatus Peregrinibacteria bacterium]
MEKNSILPILKKIPLFETFNEMDYEKIVKNITLQYYPPRHVIFAEKDQGDALYIIKSGKVRIFHPVGQDEGEKVADLKENDFFGEMSLFSEEKRNASAITETECELFKLLKKDFCELLLKDENMASRLSSEFIRRLKENNSSAH